MSTKTKAPASKNNGSPRVAITGLGLLTPLGDSRETLHGKLCAGESALRPLEHMPEERALPDAIRPFVEGRLAASIENFSPFDYLGKRNFRPLDRTGRFTTISAHLALEQSGWTAERRAEHEVGLVLGTMFGSLRTIANFDGRAQESGPQYAKPLDFANTVINAAAGQAAIWHDLRGLNSTICAGSTSGLQALAYATETLRSGRAIAILAGGAEELCLPSFYGFSKTGRMTGGIADGAAANGAGPGHQHPVPFDAARDGFALGEGAALLMLEPWAEAQSRGAHIHAEIVGHGNAFDPSRGQDADSASAAVTRSIQTALRDANLDAESIDAISCSSNGSPGGDLHEARGIAAAFQQCGSVPPVAAIKSMLGEALGASPAIQTAALISALEDSRLPGIPGLETTATDLPFEVTTECKQLGVGGDQPRRGLVTSLGLDGNACALIIELPGSARPESVTRPNEKAGKH